MKEKSMKLSEKPQGRKPPLESRLPWETPAVRQMRAGMAEVGFTNTVDDGIGTKS
jgi:hypothetical protein